MDIFGVSLTDEQEAEVEASVGELEDADVEDAEDLAQTLFILSHQVEDGAWIDLSDE